MSFNRENVIWQNAEGQWNIGFYDFYDVRPEPGEDYDPEWDVEYTGNFHWVSTGHYSEEAARNAWHGANPGGYILLEYNENNKKAIAQAEDNASRCYEASVLGRPYTHDYHQRPEFKGRPRERSLKNMLEELHFCRKADFNRANGAWSGNYNPDLKEALEKRVNAKKKNPDAATQEAFRNHEQNWLNFLKTKVAEAEKEYERYRNNANAIRGGYGRRFDSSRVFKEKAETMKKAFSEAQKEFDSTYNNVLKSVTKKDVSPEKTSQVSAARKDSYHVNPETGRPNKCYATKKACPFGGASHHYPSKAAARAGYEKQQGSSF